ncbi:MAG: prepilin-type N-terminal cleavage/methylation domain-containing protein [Deltaproteobacteria bacterium]|nr:prepilin-type N-terminal cleavage/methylation domain-containing protein [Candidatus Zymogenaceae bacterium]
MNIQDDKGFTIIELMVVVMILFIITSFAIPVFLKYRSQSMQSEARVLLSGTYTSEIAYYGEFSEFSTEPEVLNFDPIMDPKYYNDWYVNEYVNPMDGSHHFIVTCSANIDPDVFRDRWIIMDYNREPWNNWDDVNDLEDPYPFP